MSRLALSQEQDEALLREALDELDPFVFADDDYLNYLCEECGNFAPQDEPLCLDCQKLHREDIRGFYRLLHDINNAKGFWPRTPNA